MRYKVIASKGLFGDPCLYVKRDGGFVSQAELLKMAADLQDRLNGDARYEEWLEEMAANQERERIADAAEVEVYGVSADKAAEKRLVEDQKEEKRRFGDGL